MTRRYAVALWVLAGLTSTVWAYPEPAVVQDMDEWTLKVGYTQPQQIMVRMGDSSQVQRFWYIILTVTNEGPLDEVSFYPHAELVTDTFQVIPAGRNVPKSVFETIKLKHQGQFPFLESLDFADRRIYLGEDNTRDFAIIWPDFDPKARQVSLYVSGLSNETAVIEHPELKGTDGNSLKIFLRKTLELTYAVAGDERLRANAVMKEIEKDWVMR